MDTGGKDGVIHRVFEGVNPQGVQVAHFGIPSPEGLDHDFLWRHHKRVPGKGELAIFNRSHYEGVLVERVHKLVPEQVWKCRYRRINDFERLLSEEETVILKFYLHISKDEQKKRLQQRLEDPTKEWKFSSNDIPERKHWDKYMTAYEDALSQTSTDWAPWHLIPSNHKWYMGSSGLTDNCEGYRENGSPVSSRNGISSFSKTSRWVDLDELAQDARRRGMTFPVVPCRNQSCQPFA